MLRVELSKLQVARLQVLLKLKSLLSEVNMLPVSGCGLKLPNLQVAWLQV
jgi:hypothetical protein